MDAFLAYKEVVAAAAVAIALAAAFIANLATIVKTLRQFASWLRNEPFAHPILLSLRKQEMGDRTLMDVTISYEGKAKLLFYRLDVRHWPGYTFTVGTGALPSKGKYSFGYTYDTHHKYHLSPPLVLNPKSSSLLRFQVELVRQGSFPSSNGLLCARVYYKTGRGQQGILPLAQFDKETYAGYEKYYEKILNDRQLPFPDFQSPERKDGKPFPVTSTGVISGRNLADE